MASFLWQLLGAGQSLPASRKKLGVVALLYFVQGAPASILWEVLPVYFCLHGVSLRAIGGLRLLELPYSLKVFRSPAVRRYGDLVSFFNPIRPIGAHCRAPRREKNSEEPRDSSISCRSCRRRPL
jgi:hypothetical protein